MRHLSTIGFVAVVVVPVCALLWLGLRVADGEATLRRHQFDQLIQDRLIDIRDRAALAVEELEREVLESLAVDTDQEAFRDLGRTQPFVRQAFVVDGNGMVTQPTMAGASDEEREFLKRTAAIWTGQSVLHVPPSQEANSMATIDEAVQRQAKTDAADLDSYRPKGDNLAELAKTQSSGWLTWYWREGLHLLLWKRRSDAEGVVGVEVERISVLSRIVAKLPTTEQPDSRIVLVSSRGEAVHQWGLYEQQKDEEPIGSMSLAYPLDTWSLNYFAASDQRQAFVSGGSRATVLIGVIAVAIALLTLAIFLFRDFRRRLREASERVNFVTRVSHELKTPLTNIRLYAELLEHEIAAADQKDSPVGEGPAVVALSTAKKRLSVVVSESQRLTRLINNILSFSKHTREKLTVTPTWCDFGEVVMAAVDQFRPALEQHGVEPTVSNSIDEPVWADADAVEQIVANLLANVIKYATAGGVVAISTFIDGDEVCVEVADDGPGVSPRDSARIFKPFVRLSDSLSEGVSGTGIGLSIARELALLHGGSLSLPYADTDAKVTTRARGEDFNDSDSGASLKGARFQLRIPRKGKDAE